METRIISTINRTQIEQTKQNQNIKIIKYTLHELNNNNNNNNIKSDWVRQCVVSGYIFTTNRQKLTYGLDCNTG